MEGECFVFDGRVSVDHSLEPGEHTMCFGCRRPVSPEGRKDPRFIEGVCCPYCHDQLTADQIERFRERHLQIHLAEERKELHLGREVVVKEQKEPTLRERELPVLYSFRRCPYAIRARLALAATRTEVELREVVLRNKPEHMVELSPKATVPVLWKQDDSVLEESLDIMEWALHASGDAVGWLRSPEEAPGLPEHLVAENDGPFKFNLDRYKYPDRYDNVDGLEHRSAAEDFLRQLEDRLSASPFLQGPSFGWSDAAILPFIRQFANTDREWFDGAPYPIFKPGWPPARIGPLPVGDEEVQSMGTLRTGCSLSRISRSGMTPEERSAAFRRVAEQQSGAFPYTNCRTLTVKESRRGFPWSAFWVGYRDIWTEKRSEQVSSEGISGWMAGSRNWNSVCGRVIR